MLFTMVERGMDAEVVGDKGKLRSAGPTSDKTANNGEDAMWAVILTKELWRKGIWYATRDWYSWKEMAYISQ
jgi:protein SDA1